MPTLISVPEVFLASGRAPAWIVVAVGSGHLRRLGRGLYTGNMTDRPEEIVLRNLDQIVSLCYPDAHLEAGVIRTPGVLRLTSARASSIILPGLKVVSRTPALSRSEAAAVKVARKLESARAALKSVGRSSRTQPSRLNRLAGNRPAA